MVEYSYCVVNDVLENEVDDQGWPVSRGRLDILFDGGFNESGEEACNKWLAEHPEHGTAYVRPFVEID